MNATTTAPKTIVLAAAKGVAPAFVLTTADPGVVIWPCSRCFDENGKITMYSHVAGGVCFKCNGFGGDEMTLADAEVKADKLIKGRVARARKAERERLAKLAARKANQDALAARFPGLDALMDEAIGGRNGGYDNEGEYIDGVDALSPFVGKMAELFRYNPERMSDRQAEAAVDAIAKAQARNAAREAERAAATPAPSGRVVVTGEVLVVKVYDGDYGTSFKMMVKADAGYRVFCSIPSAILSETDKGTRVEFTATLEPATDDLTFAKGSRPAKARVL